MTKENYAEQIWNELKNKPINMFGLPGQTLSMHAKEMKASPETLLLKLKSQSVLVALEELLSGSTVTATVKTFDGKDQKRKYLKYDLKQHEGYISITYTIPPKLENPMPMGDVLIVGLDKK